MSVSRLLRPSEATKQLGISYSSLLRHIKEGKIPCVKIGKQIRIPERYFKTLESEAMKEVDNDQ